MTQKEFLLSWYNFMEHNCHKMLSIDSLIEKFLRKHHKEYFEVEHIEIEISRYQIRKDEKIEHCYGKGIEEMITEDSNAS